MKNIKLIRVRLLSMTVAAAVVVVLNGAPGYTRQVIKPAGANLALADQFNGLGMTVEGLRIATKVDAQGEMSGMSMGKKNPPKPAQSGMQMGQGAKKKTPRKSTGMSGKSGVMGMEDDMDDDMCCMKMMGSMSAPQMARKKGMGGMKMSSALPGFPGSSHLYHIGSTGFFLDHPTHITLTSDQQMTLNRIKEKAVLDQSDADRKIEEAEQQMWQLTAAASPDADKIEAKAPEIEKVRADQRLAFIRAVGEAAKVLTPEQQQVLLGTKPAGAKNPPHKM